MLMFRYKQIQKQKDMLKLPFLTPPVAFEPVRAERDELIASIDSDPVTHDDVWKLDEPVDAERLAGFWDTALRELKDSELDS